MKINRSRAVEYALKESRGRSGSSRGARCVLQPRQFSETCPYLYSFGSVRILPSYHPVPPPSSGRYAPSECHQR
eukprot:4458531-Pyramimonas_sp.AAC.1